MPRVLVTGTAGFIGSHLAGRCLCIGMEVIATDHLPVPDVEPRFSPHFAAADRLAEPSNHTGTHALRMSTVQPECEPLDEVHDRPKTLVNARSGLRRIAARSGLLVDNRIRHLRSFLTHGLTVVVYHEVTERPSEFQKISGGFTTPELFEQQVDWIGERFTPISPMDLPQLGGTGKLPSDAALITFDDAWAGVFRAALPILASKGIPSLCFVNMATVQGTPDLAAVRRYERITHPSKRSRLDDKLDTRNVDQVLATIEARYREADDFRRFQGETATLNDVAEAPGPVWLASHLFHHWDANNVSSDVFTASARHNWAALTCFPNALPVVATPYGRRPDWLVDRARELDLRAVFVVTGGQNHDPGAFVLDRLQLEPAPSGPEDWWWATHRRRLMGSLAG